MKPDTPKHKNHPTMARVGAAAPRESSVLRTRVLGVFASAVLFCGPVLHAAQWYESYEKGLTAVRAGRWQEAIQFLSDAIRDNPEEKANAATYGPNSVDYFPYVYRALAYLRTGDRKKALEDFEQSDRTKAVFQATSDREAARVLLQNLDRLRAVLRDEALFTEAVELYRQREFARSAEKFRSLPAGSPFSNEGARYIALADSELKRDHTLSGAPAPGSPATRDSIGVLPGQPDTTSGGPATNAGTPSPARKPPGERKQPRLSRVVAQELPTDEALLEKGEALFAQGQYPGAKEALENFLALYPGNTRARAYLDTIAANDLTIRRGITAYLEGNYRFAIQELKEAALRNRGSPRLYAFLATAYAAAYLLSGNTERSFRELAVESYRTARALDATYVLDTNFVSPRIVSMLNSR